MSPFKAICGIHRAGTIYPTKHEDALSVLQKLYFTMTLVSVQTNTILPHASIVTVDNNILNPVSSPPTPHKSFLD